LATPGILGRCFGIGLYKDDKKTGYWRDPYGNFNLSEGQYVDDQQEGIWIQRLFDGQINSIINFHKEKWHGYFAVYHPNGQLANQMEYRMGLPWNLVGSFDSSGNPLNNGYLKNGNGEFRYYSQNQELVRMEKYKGGMHEGLNMEKRYGTTTHSYYHHDTVWKTETLYRGSNRVRIRVILNKFRQDQERWEFDSTGRLELHEWLTKKKGKAGEYFYANGHRKAWGYSKPEPYEHGTVYKRSGYWTEVDPAGNRYHVLYYRGSEQSRKLIDRLRKY
jgi:hypothetical protein